MDIRIILNADKKYGCAICFERFDQNEKVLVCQEPCNKLFHHECFYKTIEEVSLCDITCCYCKRRLVTKDILCDRNNTVAHTLCEMHNIIYLYPCEPIGALALQPRQPSAFAIRTHTNRRAGVRGCPPPNGKYSTKMQRHNAVANRRH